MHRRNGLAQGWYLLKPKADAVARRAALTAATKRLNARYGTLAGLGPLLAAPSREDFEAHQTYGRVRAARTTDPVGFECHSMLRHDDSPQPFSSRADRISDARMETERLYTQAGHFADADHRSVAAEMRAMAERVIATTDHLAEPVRLTALGGYLGFGGDTLYMTICVSTVGHDLKVDIEQVTNMGMAELEVRLKVVVAEHIRLEAVRSKAQAAGIPGWIDGAATRVLASSGLGLPRLLDLLTRHSIIEMSWSTDGRPRRRVILRWLDGVITAFIGKAEDDFSYKRGLLSIRQPNLPETIRLALPGRSLGSLVSHPLIPSEPTITDLRDYSGWLFVTVDERVTPIVAGVLQPEKAGP